MAEEAEDVTDGTDGTERKTAVGECPLDPSRQLRNLALFAGCTGLQYLAAPVLYVGITQAALCDKLEASTSVANLPTTMFFAMTATPALLAWLSPGIARLRRNLGLCYLAVAASLAVTAVVLALPVSNAAKLAMIVVQGGVTGAAMPTAIALLWEAIGRGSDESRRGLALGLAFGAGPVLAVIGSLGQTMLMGGNLFGLQFEGIEHPMCFVILFAAGAPVMAVAAVLSQSFVIPPADHEPKREPAAAVAGLLIGLPSMVAAIVLVQAAEMYEIEWLGYAGILAAVGAVGAFAYHFRPILTSRVLLLATLVTVLVYSGNTITPNMNLYTKEVLKEAVPPTADQPAGEPAETAKTTRTAGAGDSDAAVKYAGIQNALRFGFKAVAGLLLGWLLVLTSPRAGLLMTAMIFLAAQVWAMFATGPLYLVAFGLYGAGELVGVYAPNYILSASRPQDLRRNMAFVTLLMVPAAPTGYLFGTIVDRVKKSELSLAGMNNTELGFRISFLVCAVLILAGIVLAVTLLPSRPRPAAEPPGGSHSKAWGKSA